LLMETPLSTRFAEQDVPATAKSAAESAKKVSGQRTTFLACRKSPMGIGFKLPPVVRSGGPRGPGERGSTRGPDGPTGPPGPALDPMKHNPNDRFARLTPEQRVQRAQQRQQGGGGQIVERRVEQN